MQQVEKPLLQNKYEIITKIKQGGFGVVYYGFDRVFDKPVAIKAIEPALLKETKYVDLFLDEAKNAAKLSHNNIVHIYDLVKNENGQFFIIMEFIEGYDLGRIIQQCRKKQIILPLDLSTYIIKEVCKALEYAHIKRNPITNEPLKLVHQDISPSNLMISLTGQIKLIDFGLAKLRIQKTKSNEITISGKLPYLAPEQINGGVIDRRTDVFSLGVIFYEMITGFRFIDSEDSKEAIQQIKKNKLDITILEKNNIPKSIQNILTKMLHKNPDERYFGANGVYLDLIEFLMSSSHSVDLSDELSDYIKELYKTDNSTIKTSNEFQKTSDNIETILSKKGSVVVNKDGAQNLDSNLKSEKNKKQLQELQSTKKPESASVSAANETNTKKHQDVELEKILTEIEQNFTNDSNVQPISLTGTSIKDRGKEQKTIQPKISQKATQQIPSQVNNSFPGEDEDDLKTVIDVIRLSTRSHQKTVKTILKTTVVFLLFFIAFDFIMQFSPVGKSLRNLFYPPAIKISTVPEGANVYLNDKRISGTTPISIPKITPGVYQLTLTHAGFNPLTKSIQVPANGKITIAGEKNSQNEKTFLFRFKSRVELNSSPTGATVYLNNVKYPQRTPTSFEWQAGLPLSIEMEHDGFSKIGGLTLNTLDDSINIKDDPVWFLEMAGGQTKNYNIEGRFKKFIKLKSIPLDVAWFIDGSTTPSGSTKASNSIVLAIGEHEILFKKQGFNDKLITVNVDENGPENISLIMDRSVHFNAYENFVSDTTEIHANITRYLKNNKLYTINKVTPCDVVLPAVDVIVRLEKDGYENSEISVSAEEKNILVGMEISKVAVEIFVQDALTELPLGNTNIMYLPKDNNQAEQILFGTTDENGKCINSVKLGEYNFIANKTGYFNKELVFNTKNENKILEFKLIIQ